MNPELNEILKALEVARNEIIGGCVNRLIDFPVSEYAPLKQVEAAITTLRAMLDVKMKNPEEWLALTGTHYWDVTRDCYMWEKFVHEVQQNAIAATLAGKGEG